MPHQKLEWIPNASKRVALSNAAPIPLGPMARERGLDVPAECGFYVYIHRGPGGQPMYVGRTTNPLRRVLAHDARRATLSHWFRRVESIEHIRYPNFHASYWAELRLIDKLCPPFNKQGNPDRIQWYDLPRPRQLRRIHVDIHAARDVTTAYRRNADHLAAIIDALRSAA